ncbi:MAG: tetratricopeptide repeat protein [Reichenbachiella sp.]|uniref:tetratricopeptide repeat protein n=1 Tax=Reichenbachiella sp. TaxID=2184521 RepID=UPI0032659EF1
MRTILICLLLLIGSLDSYSQKRKKKDKGQVKIDKVDFLTEEERAEVDHYFLEGEKYFILQDQSKAMSAFKKVLELDSKNAAAHYKIAQIYSENNDMHSALPHAIFAKNYNSKNKYYYLLVTHIQTSLGDLTATEKTYLEMLANVEGTENYLFDLAAVQFYQKKYEEALNTYQKAEDHFGEMEQIIIQRQQIYLNTNRLDMAIAEGKKLIALYPNEPSHAVTLAQMMLSNDKFVEAESFILSKIEQYQNNERLYIFLSEAYSKQNKDAKAVEVLEVPFSSSTLDLTRKIRTMAGYLAKLPNEELNAPLLKLAETLVQTHPNSYQALAMTGDLHYNMNNRRKGREYYLKAVEIDGSNFNIWQNILSLDLELEAYDDVIKHTEQALQIFPNQATLYYFGGTAYLIKKDYESALKVFNAGKSYTARDSNMKSLFHGQLGDAYNSLGDHSKSDEAYEIALDAKPDNDHVLNNYSYFLSLRKKDLDKAFEMSSKLVKAYPENPTYLDTHAWVLYMMGDFEGAERNLKQALLYDPSATIIEHYGDALFQLGKVDEAIIQWKTARDMAEDTTTLDKKIADKQLYE